MITEARTKWAVVSTYGTRIKTLGKHIEWCDLPLDDFKVELDEIEHCVKKVREQIAYIRGGRTIMRTIKLNTEMFDEAVERCGGSIDKLKKDLFG